MSVSVRDGRLDVAILAGPRLAHWPSPGVRAISSLCARMGLTAGFYGGESLTVRGVVPLPGTGGTAIIEDGQQRIHRVQARAIVRVVPAPEIPDPFSGWRSEGLIPISTALRLYSEALVLWDPATVILGTGNRALRFGSRLLEGGTPSVTCVESAAHEWGGKRYAGWEVERRRFEVAGGKIIEAVPLQLSRKAAQYWELKLRDAQGVRVVEAARVVSAGPFRDSPGVREHPPGSLLFELEQTSDPERAENVEGWVMEEERGRWLGARIVRSLVPDLAEKREEIDLIYRRARSRLKRYLHHREEPHTPAYQGKWIVQADARAMREFKGVPKIRQKTQAIASIECFEEIPCNICMQACPYGAIEIGRVPRTRDAVLREDACTSCGICVSACPSAAITLVREPDGHPLSSLHLSWRGRDPWRQGEIATLINRRGETLGSARIKSVSAETGQQVVEVEVPSHLTWEARALRRVRSSTSAVDESYLGWVGRAETHEEKVEVTFDGDKRLVRREIPTAIALFEVGRNRPEEALLCPDGSCGLCSLSIDGVRKMSCQETVHRGMAIRLPPRTLVGRPSQTARVVGKDGDLLCPCLGISAEAVRARLRQGRLRSPEAVISVAHVGEGKCHGQLCREPLRRMLEREGINASDWIDWSFPWMDWTPNEH